MLHVWLLSKCALIAISYLQSQKNELDLSFASNRIGAVPLTCKSPPGYKFSSFPIADMTSTRSLGSFFSVVGLVNCITSQTCLISFNT